MEHTPALCLKQGSTCLEGRCSSTQTLQMTVCQEGRGGSPTASKSRLSGCRFLQGTASRYCLGLLKHRTCLAGTLNRRRRMQTRACLRGIAGTAPRQTPRCTSLSHNADSLRRCLSQTLDCTAPLVTLARMQPGRTWRVLDPATCGCCTSYVQGRVFGLMNDVILWSDSWNRVDVTCVGNEHIRWMNKRWHQTRNAHTRTLDRVGVLRLSGLEASMQHVNLLTLYHIFVGHACSTSFGYRLRSMTIHTVISGIALSFTQPSISPQYK